MADELSIESLRAAIRNRGAQDDADDARRLQTLAKGYEAAVAGLVAEITAVARQVPDLDVAVEDEREEFTSPAFPGRTVPIQSQRVRITLLEDFVLFDPTAEALASALGQVRISASRPIPFLIERTLYLMRPRAPEQPPFWAFRSAEDPLRYAVPFDSRAFLRVLHAVFS